MSLDAICIDEDLPSIGDIVEGYRIEEPLHIGPMTVLFRGEAETTSTSVVLQFCRPCSSVSFRRSFELSRNLQARIDNPHVARILGGCTWKGGLPVAIRQFIPGKTLEAYLAVSGGFPAQICLALAEFITGILAEISDLVEETRWAGYFHRCLWMILPGDVVVTPHGRVFLLSHGINHHFDVRLYDSIQGQHQSVLYSPSMDQTTIIHSIGVLIRSMIAPADDLLRRSAELTRKQNDAEMLLSISSRCDFSDNRPTGDRLQSLFDLHDAIRTLRVKRLKNQDPENIISSFFSGAQQSIRP